MMPHPTPSAAALRAALLVVLVLATACSTMSRPGGGEDRKPDEASSAPAPKGESDALAAAQGALESGDCRRASELYLAAAGFSSEAEVAMRASQLALICNNLPAARAAARRWSELDPYSGEAALTAAVVAMKRYDVEAARAALIEWRDSGTAGGQDPLSFAAGISEEVDVALFHRLFSEVLVGEDPTAEVLLAKARLALAAQDMEAAIDAAEGAATLEAGMLEAQVIVLRALSVLGEHEAALAGASQLVREGLQGEGVFLLPDLMLAAGRTADAQNVLEQLAEIEDPEVSAGAARRLIALAFRQGRLDQAALQLQAMRERQGVTALSVLYLAELAERSGNRRQAIQTYGLLADTALALSARSAAARLMVQEGDSAAALQLLDEHAEQNPQEALQAGLSRVHILGEAGNLKAALASLDKLAQRYPDHPDLDYARATVLESGGRTRQAVAEFERALKLRPEDPQLLNALGYTLADHKQRLAEAEAMIRKALVVSPDSPAIQDSLGWVLYRRGKTDEALPVLARAWRNSVDAEIGAHYGEVLWKSGDEGQARYVWQQALNGQPDHEGLRTTMARLTGEDADAR